MEYSRVNKNSFLIRLVKGEEVVISIKSFCEKKGIKNAWFSGLGSIENPTLAHYRVDTKKYSEKKLNGIFEVTNMTGNVGVFDNAPLVHAHITLSNDAMQAFGGHLVSTVVSATLEVELTDLGSHYTKLYSEEIGLKLWDLPEEIRP